MLNLDDKDLLTRYGYKPPRQVLSSKPYSTGLIGKNASTSREGDVLVLIINHYLVRLGISPLFEGVSGAELFRQSTIGDALVRVELVERLPSSLVVQFSSNSFMKLALLRLGWFEFESCPEHFAGTVFEALFSLADLMGRVDVKLRLLNALIGEIGYLPSRLSLSDFQWAGEI